MSAPGSGAAVATGLHWAFASTQILRVEALVHPDNGGSIRLLERLGFVCEGRLREAGFWGGQHHDMLAFGLLSADGVGSAADARTKCEAA